MKKLLLFTAVLCSANNLLAQGPPYFNRENLRSDTFDIFRYTINLEIGNTTSPQINGHTIIKFAPLINNQAHIRFDLLKLQVDSVKEGNTTLTYIYNDTILRINFSTLKNTGDTSSITIYYHGQPQIDATGWGGFYFNNTQGAQYAYNLGVGFGANPHNYGRVWFPCFDNFVERSDFDFRITTDSARKAFCGGMLVNDSLHGGKRTRRWFLQEQIPTYLASVSVARYSQINWTANTLTGPKPVIIAAHGSDTVATKTAFANLFNCINGFENYFGPYRWSRFGYALVPFNGGAMEHATNITYPRTSTGSLAHEDLISHELAHHWWGNLITCSTPEDMWINEGFASFSAHLFFEWQYGKNKYLERIRTQHEDLLHFLHHREGGFKPVSGLPHAYTYSDHVYKKGAIMAHNLRGYLGDSLFFTACKALMQQKAFQPVNSNEMRDIMQQASGKNLSDFFNDWIYHPGWSHFSIDSFSYTQQAGKILARIYLQQKTFGAPALHSNVPLEISFFRSDKTRETRSLVMNGINGSFTFTLDFQPALCALNYDSKICDATASEWKMIKSTGPFQFNIARGFVNVTDSGNDSTLLRINHHYVKPDDYKDQSRGHKISNQHYWSVEGIFDPGFRARLRFYYDGNKTLSGYGYMDTLLARHNGDSIALFYRPDSRHDWTWLSSATKVKLGTRQGYFETDSLMAGEYVFANLGDTSSTSIPEIHKQPFSVYPNPASQQLTVSVSEYHNNAMFRLLDIQGKTILRQAIHPGKNLIDISTLPKGTYFTEISSGKSVIYKEKLLLH